MHKKLEKYLEEIGQYITDPAERGEILSEIRSHILEKAEQEDGPVSDASLDKAIAVHGTPRQVAERYLESQPIIAPVFRRHLFRYTSLLFAIHLVVILLTVVLKRSVSVFFPFVFVPRLNLVEAVLYLPMAFLADFGLVALVLLIITRSGKELRLPWPKFAFHLDEVQAPALKTLAAKIGMAIWSAILLALTVGASALFLTYRTLFLVKQGPGPFRPFLLSEPGLLLSLAIIIGLAAGAMASLIKLFALPRRAAWWINAFADAAALALIGLVLGLPHGGSFMMNLPEKLRGWTRSSLVVTLLVVALVIGYDLVINLVRLGRSRLTKKKNVRR
ncbi:MAG: hypothetical protein JXO51_10460 [Candidatus Aminicenantes bacterium]|nr:hypothetical protein [Candidatus Aminicenantes bacterium]